jgi:hypothetical protein
MTGIEKTMLAWAVVVTILLVAWGVAALIEEKPQLLRKLMVPLAIIALGAISLAFMLVTRAYPHDHQHLDRNDWLKSLHANNRTWCCDGNDTDAVEDWEAKAGGYRVKFRGQWFDVPEGAVVDGPNKLGEPLLWMSKGYGGPSVRCFMPGSMS